MAMRSPIVTLSGVALVTLVSACTPERSSGADASKPMEPRPSSRAQPAPPATPVAAPSSTAVAADGCTGREMHDCAKTKGCLLDQPTYAKPQCRPAESACERSVRHADLIGKDADPSVTPEMTAAAEAACTATPGCAVTSGRCSCPCAVLGNCDCSCGGSYFRRCTTLLERSVYDGRPPGEGGSGPLGALGDALVKVRRAPRDQRFVINPLPPVDALVGKPRHEIEGFLGTPYVCTDTTTAPCKAAGQAFYSFYKLPTGSLGGGPELLLTYGPKSVCTEARFAHTR